MSSSDEATNESPTGGIVSSVTSSTVTSSTQTAAVERKPSVLSVGAGAIQYLNPDFSPSLSVSIDSSNSPLAMLARTCNNIGKNLPITSSSSSRSAQLHRAAGHHPQHHPSHQNANQQSFSGTAPRLEIKSGTSPTTEHGKKSSAAVAHPVSDRISRTNGCTDGVPIRKDVSAGVATVVGSRAHDNVGSIGVVVTTGSASRSPVSTSSSSPIARFSARHRDTENTSWNVVHRRLRSSASRSGVIARRASGTAPKNAAPVRPVPVSNSTTEGMREPKSRPSVGGYESAGLFDLLRYCNSTTKSPSRLETKTASVGEADDEDCNVEDSADDDQDQVNECRSTEVVEQMLQRYAADIEAEIQRRSSVQRIMQHNRNAMALQTALAAAAAATYHSIPPGLLGQASEQRGVGLSECSSGRFLLPPGTDQSLYSALVAAARQRLQFKEEEEVNRVGDVSGNGSPTSSFCSPVNTKDSSALSNDEDMDSESSPPTMRHDENYSAQNNYYKHANGRHKLHHQFRNSSNPPDEAFASQPTATTQHSGLLFHAAVAAAAEANGFSRSLLADRNESSSVMSLTCNWLTTSGQFCGRRFVSSDDLFHHLQSHVMQASSPDASLADHQRAQARHSHQLAAALTAGLLQSPLSQYHNAMEAVTPSGIPATSGILPPLYPMLFGGRNAPIPPIMAAALTSSIQSAALGRRNGQQQQFNGNNSPPLMPGTHLDAAANMARYHPYGKLSSLSVLQAGTGQPHHHHVHHHHSSNDIGAGLVVPSLGAYLSSSSVPRPQRLLGPVVGP